MAADSRAPERQDTKLQEGLTAMRDRNFALAAAPSPGLQVLPEDLELSKHIVVTNDARINIDIVDPGRAFDVSGRARRNPTIAPAGSSSSSEQIRKMPYRVAVTGQRRRASNRRGRATALSIFPPTRRTPFVKFCKKGR